MTFKQACDRAMELEGVSKEDIRTRSLYAFSNVPDAPVHQELDLVDGKTEEDMIEAMRKIWRELNSLPPEVRAALQKQMEEEGGRNAASN